MQLEAKAKARDFCQRGTVLEVEDSIAGVKSGRTADAAN